MSKFYFLRRLLNIVKRKLIPFSLYKRLGIVINPILNDRILLEILLKDVSVENALLVGVDYYTWHYPNLMKKRVFNIETLDIRESVAIFGADCHYAIDYLNFNSNKKYGFISLNGIIGYGVNDEDNVERMIKATYDLCESNAMIQLGWNANKFEKGKLLVILKKYGFNVVEYFDVDTINNYPGYKTIDMSIMILRKV